MFSPTISKLAVMLSLNRRTNSTTPNEPLLHTQDTMLEEKEESKASNLVKRTCQESKMIWEIAGPSIFNRLTMFSLTVISQSFAGHLGNRDLAALSIATTFFISITFGFLVCLTFWKIYKLYALIVRDEASILSLCFLPCYW